MWRPSDAPAEVMMLRMRPGVGVDSASVYAYSAYGETAVLGPDGGNALRYTGREDDGSGLFYYRARYYDPVLKRFVTEDPIELDAGPNFHTYVEGDPIGKNDPLGLRSVPNKFAYCSSYRKADL